MKSKCKSKRKFEESEKANELENELGKAGLEMGERQVIGTLWNVHLANNEKKGNQKGNKKGSEKKISKRKSKRKSKEE